jgi:hypothetical protein
MVSAFETFTVSGFRSGRPVEVTWEKGGKLSGDPDCVTWIERLAKNAEGGPMATPIWTPAPYGRGTHDNLKDPYKALALIKFVMPGPPPAKMIAGEWPELPPIPEGIQV